MERAKEIKTVICILLPYNVTSDINYPELIKESIRRIIRYFGTKWSNKSEDHMPIILVDCSVTEEDIAYLESIMPSTSCKLLCLQGEKDNVKSTDYMIQVL